MHPYLVLRRRRAGADCFPSHLRSGPVTPRRPGRRAARRATEQWRERGWRERGSALVRVWGEPPCDGGGRSRFGSSREEQVGGARGLSAARVSPCRSDRALPRGADPETRSRSNRRMVTAAAQKWEESESRQQPTRTWFDRVFHFEKF